MIKVYIASPYSIGDQARNVFRSFETANTLIGLGFCPFCPLLTHFQHMMFPQTYEKWLDLDIEWLKQCDFLLRLEGESKGADIEEVKAKELGIPVFYSIEDLQDFLIYHGTEENV